MGDERRKGNPVVLQTLAGTRDAVRGESADDLRAWLSALTGGPAVSHTLVAACRADSHEADPPTWFYVEADAAAGVARRRCVGCGQVAVTLDSDQRWSHPPMHACTGCGQSLMEFAAGLHTEPAADPGGEPLVTWLAIAARCVGCGRIDGLTDLVVAEAPLSEIAGAL